jgi:hypothetical protein
VGDDYGVHGRTARRRVPAGYAAEHSRIPEIGRRPFRRPYRTVRSWPCIPTQLRRRVKECGSPRPQSLRRYST